MFAWKPEGNADRDTIVGHMIDENTTMATHCTKSEGIYYSWRICSIAQLLLLLVVATSSVHSILTWAFTAYCLYLPEGTHPRYL